MAKHRYDNYETFAGDVTDLLGAIIQHFPDCRASYLADALQDSFLEAERHRDLPPSVLKQTQSGISLLKHSNVVGEEWYKTKKEVQDFIQQKWGDSTDILQEGSFQSQNVKKAQNILRMCIMCCCIDAVA